MSEQAENQVIEGIEGQQAPASLLDQVFGPPIVNQTLQPQPVAETPVAETPKVEVVAEVVAEAEASKAEEVDPYEAVVAGVGPKEPTAWDENSLKAFKDFFGAEDPKAFKEQYETEKTARELEKAELDKWAPLKQQIDALPPTQAEALRLMLSGKVQEAQDYIRNTPDIILQNKEAKNIDSEKLIDIYFPGKMTAAQFEAMKDPDTDPDIVEALKTKMGIYREMATEKHEAQRKEIAERAINETAANAKRWENFQAANAATIAHAKQTPLGVFVDKQFTDEITSGKFLSRYVQEDGVSPTPEGATLLLKGLHYDKAVEAARKSAVRGAKVEGKLEAMSEMPTGPRPSRDAGDANKPKTVTLEEQVLGRI